MLASNNSYFAETAQTMYQLSADEEIRLRCQAREDYERLQRSQKHAYEKVVAECATVKAEYTALKTEYDTLQDEVARLKAELEATKRN